jgi:succinate-semialdehyde dehydrogenase/glutarate-semialdehyde dehydrogenase
MAQIAAHPPEEIARLRRQGLLLDRGYVAGEWIEADGGETFRVIDPATGHELARVPRMGADETRRAIDAAREASPSWRATLAKERARIMRRWADLMLEHLEDLSLLLTAEQGKPLAESRAEITYAASFLEWFGEEAKRVYGDTIPTYLADRRVVVTKEPVGVTAGITPWNFPSAMITRKAAPAIAAGCTMVLKPAEQTPLSALAVAKLAEEAGLPPGVLSIVTGDAQDAQTIGAEMTSNAIVRKLGFTGSTEVGKLLMAQCAGQVKKVSLELGGNAPFIVFDDADLDEAVAGALLCKYRNSGQTCISANRILVQDSIHDEFLDRLTRGVTALRVGAGTEADVNVGPLIDEQALAKVERHVADALEGGAELLLGGERHERGHTFFQPSVLTGVTSSMAMSCEETFGPVAGIARFTREEDAIEVANNTPYGLAAYFYSRDMGRVWRVAEGLEYGIVGINTGFISTEIAPFGGMKESGIGREGSKYGIEEWLELKYLALGGVDV